MKPNWRYHQHAEQSCDTGACENAAAFLIVVGGRLLRLCGKCFLALMAGKGTTV